MPKPATLPAIWLIQPDAELGETLAQGLRLDGMTVSVFPTIEPALEALHRGERPAVLVVAPLNGPLTDLEFTEQAKALSPRVSVIFTPRLTDAAHARPGAHILAHPLDSAKLSRFIRLVGGRPAFRSSLQSLYREAHPSQTAPSEPCRIGGEVAL
jgi:DNA-binding NtrC family response regulator